MKPEVIVVEDEKRVAQALANFLERDGFRVTILNEGTSAVEHVREHEPAFVILDLMLPGKGGVTICQEVRAFSTVPILMLTAKVDEIDSLLNLEVGADDYVCKPFGSREVLGRVNTILRRIEDPPMAMEHGDITYRNVSLFPDQLRCVAGGLSINLTPIEFRILNALMAQPGRVFAREKLTNMVYADRCGAGEKSIDTHVRKLRKRLSVPGIERDLIHSIYGVGYKME